MKKILSGVVVALILVIALVASWLYFGFLKKDNHFDYNQFFEESASRIDEAFWVEDDYEAAYTIATERADQLLKLSNEDPNPENLYAESMARLEAAKVARLYDFKVGIEEFASIYNNHEYSDEVRADALYHVLFYVAEKVGNELSVTDVSAYIYAPHTFGPLVNIVVPDALPLETKEEILDVTSKLLIYNAAMTESNRLSNRSLVAAFDLSTKLLLDEVIATYWNNPTLRTETLWNYMQQTLSTEQLIQLQLLVDSMDVATADLLSMMEDKDTYIGYTTEFSNTAKNLVRTYIKLATVGFDVKDNLSALFDAAGVYLERHLAWEREGNNVGPIKNIEIQQGVFSLYNACSAVAFAEVENREIVLRDIEERLTDFMELSDRDQSRFSAVKAVGIDKQGYCYHEYLVIGNLLPAFKQSLITNIGGWNEQQFTN